MHGLRWFEDGYIEYNDDQMIIAIEDHHYASNMAMSVAIGITWEGLLKIEDINLSMITEIEKLQKRYLEINER